MFNWLKQNVLLFVVFLTGAAVLMVEVLAVRILSPYFGATIFTVSSVISTILLALSLGYYFGGRLADKFPSTVFFYAIILASGFSVFILLLVMTYLVPLIGYHLSIITGPLILSLLLFLTPSLLLGTLSPFAIKLLSLQKSAGVGQVSGLVFFFSTLGSIAGSLSSGFLLIPFFGQRIIIAGIGLGLFLLGAFGLIAAAQKKLRLKLWLIFFLGLIGLILISVRFVQAESGHYLVSAEGFYEQIRVVDRLDNGRPARFLFLDRNSSSALYLDDQSLVYGYTKYYELYQTLIPEMDRALVLGGGAYTVPKKLIEENKQTIVDVVEIEPKLLPIARQFFFLPESNRLINHVTDARRFLLESDLKYDFIFSDAYNTLFSTPNHLVTTEFFSLVNDHLTDDGLLMINAIGSLTFNDRSLLLSQIKTLRSVFPEVKVFAVDDRGSSGVQNFIIIAARNDQVFSQAGIPHEYQTHEVDLNRFDFEPHKIMTDDSVSSEYLLISEFKKVSLGSAFNGDETMKLIDKQLNFGPRHVNSSGHQQLKEFLARELVSRSDRVLSQVFIPDEAPDVELENLIGQIYPDRTSRFLLVTHYDTKETADKDEFSPGSPVPGANDGASGVAALLELLPKLRQTLKDKDFGLDVVLFDGEEIYYTQSNWSPLGSKYFVQDLSDFYPNQTIAGVINIDLICDQDLEIFADGVSAAHSPELNQSFFDLAADAFPDNFKSEIKYHIIDDHSAFIKANIPAIVLIDMDYPAFHTTRDDLTQCSVDSLSTVGTVINKFFARQ